MINLNDSSTVLMLLLAGARVGGMLVVAPVLGNRALPARLRVFISLVIALAVVGRVAQPAAMPAGTLALSLAIVLEAAIGMAIGYAARLIFVGVELGAFHISQQMGISLAETIDPLTQEPDDPVRSLYRITALVIFLAIGGHCVLISSLLGTFESVPLLGGVSGGAAQILKSVTGLLAASFVLAIKVALPALAALLMATVAMAILGRTVPQMNLFSVGLPLRALVGMLALSAALAYLPAAMDAAWRMWMRNMEVLVAR